MPTIWAWILTASLTVSGLFALALAYWFHWGGTYLLIAPMLFAAAAVSGAISSGLRDPRWAAVIIFGVLVGFVIVRYLNLGGLGSVV